MRHIHAEHQIAAANDTTIQWQSRTQRSRWYDCAPTWDVDQEYRQKPAMVDMWQWAITYCKRGAICATDEYFATEAEAQIGYECGVILCRIDGNKITVPAVQS